MKKLILSAAFLIALSSFAAAQSTEGTSSAKITTATATANSPEIVKKEKTPRISKKERKAAAALEANKSVKISVPVPDISQGTLPKNENE